MLETLSHRSPFLNLLASVSRDMWKRGMIASSQKLALGSPSHWPVTSKIPKLGCSTMAVDYTNLFLFDVVEIKAF